MKKISPEEYQEITKGTGTIVFTTPNCARCDTVKEMCRNLQIHEFELRDGMVSFYHTIPLPKITEAPIVIHFRNGKEVGRLSGINNTQAYINLISQ